MIPGPTTVSSESDMHDFQTLFEMASLSLNKTHQENQALSDSLLTLVS